MLLDCQGAPAVHGDRDRLGGAARAARRCSARRPAGKRVRLVSMPCTEVFDAQDAAYRESVLPAAVTARVAVEAGSTGLWWRYVG